VVLGSKEIGLEINGDKTKYMVVSRVRNAEEIHSMKFGNNFFQRVEKSKYLGIALTYQNSLEKQIKSRLNSGDSCCHSVQNLLSSSLLSKNLKINVYRIIILPFFFWMAVELGRSY